MRHAYAYLRTSPAVHPPASSLIEAIGPSAELRLVEEEVGSLRAPRPAADQLFLELLDAPRTSPELQLELWMTDLAQLFRSSQELTSRLPQLLRARVRVVALDDGLDTGELSQRLPLLLDAFRLIDAHRRRIISEATTLALRRVQAAGKALGGARGRLLVNPLELKTLWEAPQDSRTGRRMLSERQVIAQLQRRGVTASRSTLRVAIARLVEQGYLDPERRAANLARYPPRGGGRPKKPIRADRGQVAALYEAGHSLPAIRRHLAADKLSRHLLHRLLQELREAGELNEEARQRALERKERES